MKDTCWRESEDGNPTSKLSDEMFGVFLSLVYHLLYSLVLALVSFNTWPFCKMTINIRHRETGFAPVLFFVLLLEVLCLASNLLVLSTDSFGFLNGTCFMKNESFLDFVRTSLRKCHAENVNQLVVAGRRACRLLLGQLSLKLLPQVLFLLHSLIQFPLTMGRKRLLMKRIDNPCSRQITYSKRREGILKKANELSALCDTDVGLLMFSPTGRLTSYAHKGRIEDIFLRYIDQPDDFKGPVDNEEFLYQSLKHLKYEGEMLDKIGRCYFLSLSHSRHADMFAYTQAQAVLERKLRDLNRQKYEAQDKLRSYNPDMTKILSIPEAHLHQQFVMDAIRRIEKLKKAKLLEKEISPSKPHNVEIPIIEVKDSDLTTEESVNSKRNRNQSADDQKEETRLPTGPHLSISYLKTQKSWNLQNAEDITSSEGHMC
ncbi:Transcription factor [Theobroma cacao]|nr:Transcription factor [Theobroma cacao]